LNAPLARNAWLALAALITSSGTLLCCVLPAAMVALGAGAALAGLVGNFPQLIWLSEHKGLTFGSAALMLGVAGIALWYGRRLPCPADAQLARRCARLRRLSTGLYAGAVVAFLAGVVFAFVLPNLRT
jgi:hypothetical protein